MVDERAQLSALKDRVVRAANASSDYSDEERLDHRHRAVVIAVMQLLAKDPPVRRQVESAHELFDRSTRGLAVRCPVAIGPLHRRRERLRGQRFEDESGQTLADLDLVAADDHTDAGQPLEVQMVFFEPRFSRADVTPDRRTRRAQLDLEVTELDRRR